MGTRAHWALARSGAVIIGVVALVLISHADVPRGWLLRGSAPEKYDVGVDEAQIYEGQASAFLRSKGFKSEGFGTLMQRIDAIQYAGKRVRLSGLVKTEEVTRWAGLWMRVDKKTEDGVRSVAFRQHARPADYRHAELATPQRGIVCPQGRDEHFVRHSVDRAGRGLAKRHEIRDRRSGRSSQQFGAENASGKTCKSGIQRIASLERKSLTDTRG